MGVLGIAVTTSVEVSGSFLLSKARLDDDGNIIGIGFLDMTFHTWVNATVGSGGDLYLIGGIGGARLLGGANAQRIANAARTAGRGAPFRPTPPPSLTPANEPAPEIIDERWKQIFEKAGEFMHQAYEQMTDLNGGGSMLPFFITGCEDPLNRVDIMGRPCKSPMM